MYLPRGISPELLVSQVKNTMPYIFESPSKESLMKGFPPRVILEDYQKSLSHSLTHLDYFKLCVSCHYLTCATPVPTDVDRQIRGKLWPKELSLEIAIQMAQFALESRHWDFSQVSARYTDGLDGGRWKRFWVTGHLGEWFSISCAAYCALKRYSNSPAAQLKREEIFCEIEDEVERHSEVFGSLWRAQKGLDCLKASVSIAHNFGDLDRVMDLWELSVDDPLRLFYKLGIKPFDSHDKLRYQGRLWVAGELYKANFEGSSMAGENHRHFALRKPKCLRQSPAFRIPIGPFFDDWGVQVAHSLKRLEVVEALSQGWARLPKTLGYGRALRGILQAYPDLKRPDLRGGHGFQRVLETSQEVFEKQWDHLALEQMEDIPSRA